LGDFPSDKSGQDTMKNAYTNSNMRKVIVEGAGIVNFNTALFHKFADAEPFNYIVRGLQGCTTLTIVSNQAVYYAYFYEMCSFPLENSGSEDSDQEEAGVKTNLKDEVIDLLNNRRHDEMAGGVTDAQASLKAHAASFKGTSPK
jgi:hypothetical protein